MSEKENSILEKFYAVMDPQEIARLKEYPSLSALWSDAVAQFGACPAIEDDGRTFSFLALEEAAAALRGLLRLRGFRRGDRVGLLAENSAEFAAAFLAITTLGGVAAVLPPQLEAQAVLGCSMKFGLRMLLTTPALAANCAMAEKTLGLPVLRTDETEAPPAAAEACGSDEPAAIMFTGGTTGQSKGALLSNGALTQGAYNGCLGCPAVFGQRYLLVLPLSHVFGLIRNLLTSLSTGSTLFICRNNADMFRDIGAFRPTVFVVVPALAEMALALSRRFKRNMLGDDMRYIICGAAAVPPYLVEEYH